MNQNAQVSLFSEPAAPPPPTPPSGREYDSAPAVTGRYFGRDATRTEREAGVKIELREHGRLRRGSVGHKVLAVYEGGERMTAYDASRRATGHWHQHRRDSTRLAGRLFLVKDGELPNLAPGGNKHVDAYRITDAGRAELARLAALQ